MTCKSRLRAVFLWPKDMQHIDIIDIIDKESEQSSEQDLARFNLSIADEQLLDAIELRIRGYSRKEIDALQSEDSW